MSTSIIIGLIVLVCLILVFKVMGFLLRLSVVLLVVVVGYWYLGPHFGWPALPF
ncbi:hypothetical protein [Arenimonas sp.]|jgi:hypothetical protein|uniref:hypothetical protein n=1 Tax=Arenimonas sp. TaxID=1872635 RepID=UPI0037C132E0